MNSVKQIRWTVGRFMLFIVIATRTEHCSRTPFLYYYINLILLKIIHLSSCSSRLMIYFLVVF